MALVVDRQHGFGRRHSGIEARHTREEHQGLGADHVGYQRGQHIVVAELDLVGADSVVLVDYRHTAQGEQFTDGVAGVQITIAGVEVFAHQQYLARAQPMPPEGAIVECHEPPLPNAGGGL